MLHIQIKKNPTIYRLLLIKIANNAHNLTKYYLYKKQKGWGKVKKLSIQILCLSFSLSNITLFLGAKSALLLKMNIRQKFLYIPDIFASTNKQNE